MTDAIVRMVARLASPIGKWGARLRRRLARWPWLRLVLAPLILIVTAVMALMSLIAGRHDLTLLKLFIALPLATACLIFCYSPDDEDE